MGKIKGNLKSQLRKSVVGAHPIIQRYIQKLNLPHILRSHIVSDKRMIIHPADSIIVLIHNILTQPMAMYKLPEWLETLDMEALGFSHYLSSHFNDDRIARLLDTFYTSDRKKIFFRIALRAIKLFELNCSTIHQDTTSIKLYGRYNTWKNEPLANNGHSKDHRPDLKQLVLGMNMAGDGAVPILHQVYSGNRVDDTVHVSNWNRLRQLLKTTDFTYVADSKLSTETNLSHIEFYEGKYISVMPRTWKEDGLFRDKARAGNVRWRLILERPNNRHPYSVVDKYYTTKSETLLSKSRRLIWIKSTQKAEIDRKNREVSIQKTIEKLNTLNSKINRYNLKGLAKIKAAILEVLTKRNTKKFINYSIDQRTLSKKIYENKGRPRKDSKVSITRWKEYHISFQVDKNETLRESRVDGVFPLITNIENKSAKDVLTTYKHQAFLESRHAKLKSWMEIAPLYLKKPNRVLALIDIYVIALSVASLMERDLRRAMINNGIESLPVYPEKRECKNPTAQTITRVFSNIEKYDFIGKDGEVKEYFPPCLSPLQKQILDLMEVPKKLFS